MNVYGEQAQTLAKELGLACSKTADVPMTAHFTIRDVEGHTVISASFDSEETLGKLAEFVNQGVTQAASDEAKGLLQLLSQEWRFWVSPRRLSKLKCTLEFLTGEKTWRNIQVTVSLSRNGNNVAKHGGKIYV